MANSIKFKLAVGVGIASLILIFWNKGIGIETFYPFDDLPDPTSPILFILAGTMALVLLVPKTPVSILCGAFYGWSLGTALMMAIAFSAATINYCLGFYLFHSALETLTESFRHKRWVPMLRQTTKVADLKMHVLIRLTPIPTSIISYVMGASGSQLKPFLIGSCLAVIPQSLWINVGANLNNLTASQMNVFKIGNFAVSLLCAVAVSIWITRRIRRELRDHPSEKTS
ncbi:MAG: VTT domain-containing protein [Planctomycetota bacterium]|nr:VTT domain-containing protein [Planctomycetota bacterium]